MIVIAAIYLMTWSALRHTTYGPHLFAIGKSEERARLSGIAVRRVRIGTFVVSGLLAGVAAVFYVSTYRNVAMTIGGNIALEAIAAAVLGGANVMGGGYSLMRTALGVVLIRLMQNALVVVGVPSLWQTVVTGALLIAVLSGEAMHGRSSVRAFSGGRRERLRRPLAPPDPRHPCAALAARGRGLIIVAPATLNGDTVGTIRSFRRSSRWLRSVRRSSSCAAARASTSRSEARFR